MANGLSGQKNEQKRLLGEVKVQLQEKRDPWLRNEEHFFAYNDFYRELDQLNKELEVLKTSPDSDPREVDRKEVEVTAITKMLSKAGATIYLGWLKEDLDSLQMAKKKQCLPRRAKDFSPQVSDAIQATKDVFRDTCL
ncbi:hypothetical protein L7F22_040293, partial [Adiantum nelumboides]|nr:hypothetical protein [Adiantum nelumboides]